MPASHDPTLSASRREETLERYDEAKTAVSIEEVAEE